MLMIFLMSCRTSTFYYNSGKRFYLFFSFECFFCTNKVEKWLFIRRGVCALEKQVSFAIIAIAWNSFDKWIKLYFVDYCAVIGEQQILNLFYFTILGHMANGQLKLPSNLLQDNIFYEVTSKIMNTWARQCVINKLMGFSKEKILIFFPLRLRDVLLWKCNPSNAKWLDHLFI